MKREDELYLYHYTAIDTFINIVEKQELWASNIFYMNDTYEYHWAIKLARKLLKKDMVNDSKSIENRDRVELIYEELNKLTPGSLTEPVFACSFSEKDDDLNQWRAYCSNGGVSIGFPKKELKDIAEYIPDTEIGFQRKLAKCIYDEDEQRSVIREAINRAVNTEPKGTVAGKMSPEEKHQWCAIFLLALLKDKPIKHPKFKDEQEWRWIHTPEPGIDGDERLGFRSRNGLIIPYWKFNLNPCNDKKIWRNCRITVGPNPHMFELADSIESLLKHHCRGPVMSRPDKVKISEVPHRYW